MLRRPSTLEECELVHDMLGIFYVLFIPEYEKNHKKFDGHMHSRQEPVNEFMQTYYEQVKYLKDAKNK